MAVISDFVRLPKIDSCKHLSTGMRYSAFTQWTGFLIPGLDETSVRVAGDPADIEMRKDINYYTQTRVGTAHDILLLFCHAISESISDNVMFLNGTVNVDFLSKCRNATEFLDTVKQACSMYSDRIKVRPFLGIDTDNENNLPLAEMLLESKYFEGIELYGRTYAEKPERFLSIFKTAHRMGIESRICCFGFKTLKTQGEIIEILDNLRPTHLMNPNIAINNDALRIFENGKICPEIIALGHETGLHIEFSPAPVLSGNKGDKKARVIREFAENNIPFSLCTEDILHLNKSISEFAVDLCNADIFSKEEITKIIKN